jgi:hypothetical protein
VIVSSGTDRPAIDDPRTRDALRRYRLRCLRTALLGFSGLVMATIVIGSAPDGDPKGVANVVALLGISWGGLAFFMGMSTLVRSCRMSALFKRTAWTQRRAAYRIAPIGGNGQPALVIKEDGSGGEAVCSVSATAGRYHQLEQGPDIPLLVVGNPRRWSVIAPPELHVLLVAKRPWMPFWGRKLREYAIPE